jgi:hypothetical protein
MSESQPEAQTTSAVMLIRPVRFQSNAQTAANNSFQDHDAAPDPVVAQRDALVEFERLVAALEGAGVRVNVFDDLQEPHTPDSIFPNNWFSSHQDGSVILYPMFAPNRRSERRMDIVASLSDQLGFRIDKIIDLSGHEMLEQYLEGTGSMVLDRSNKIAYACHSARTHRDLLLRFAESTGYQVISFAAEDDGGAEIYHTNVLMCVGQRFAAVCLDAIQDPAVRSRVEQTLTETGHQLVSLSLEQMSHFAGNMLELTSTEGEPLIAMSQSAFDCLGEGQRTLLAEHGRLLPVDIETIERCAGGSLRCMIAELHLPQPWNHA